VIKSPRCAWPRNIPSISPRHAAFVASAPEDAGAHIEAAYAHDRADLEHDANPPLRDRVSPRACRPTSVVTSSSGSARRCATSGRGGRCGRCARASDRRTIQIIRRSPRSSRLALLSAGHPRQAIATLLGCALDISPTAFDGYDRALGEYHRELLAQPSDESSGTVGR